MFEDILKAKHKVEKYVKKRMEEFSSLKEKGITHYDFRPFLDVDFYADTFSELCFCLLTANSSASMGIRIQKDIGIDGFRSLSSDELRRILSKHGHRFVLQRAGRIVKARNLFSDILDLIKRAKSGKEVRELLSDTCSKYKVEGFGLKEASHFLRNIGFQDVAIIDRHVFRYMKEMGMLSDQKTITRKVYLRAEEKLEEVCSTLGIVQAELDLYIFYIKTGKVLK